MKELRQFAKFIVRFFIDEIWDRVIRSIIIFFISLVIEIINATDMPLWGYKLFNIPQDKVAIGLNTSFDVMGWIALPFVIVTGVSLFGKLIIHLIKVFIEMIKDTFSS